MYLAYFITRYYTGPILSLSPRALPRHGAPWARLYECRAREPRRGSRKRLAKDKRKKGARDEREDFKEIGKNDRGEERGSVDRGKKGSRGETVTRARVSTASRTTLIYIFRYLASRAFFSRDIVFQKMCPNYKTTILLSPSVSFRIRSRDKLALSDTRVHFRAYNPTPRTCFDSIERARFPIPAPEASKRRASSRFHEETRNLVERERERAGWNGKAERVG